jgi:hypothetical protein
MSSATDKRERGRDVDAEPEIDLGRVWRGIILRWWLLLLGLVAGAIIGLLVSLGGGKQWKATSEVYLGQPLAPGSSAPISSTSTSLGLANYFVTADVTIRNAAARAGLPPGKLRGHVSSKPILGLTGTKLGTAAPILAITVTSSDGAKAAKASNAIAALVIGKLSSYSTQKLNTLAAAQKRNTQQLKVVTARIDAAIAGQQKLLTSSLDSSEKLIALANFNATLTAAWAQQEALQANQVSNEQQVAAIQGVEAPHVVASAAATNTGGPSRRSGVIIGAVIGLVLGLLAAALWEPVSSQIRSHQAS